eukprot:CAMPEP_0184699278 /NCGR_PEP_ID=MMETSP0313-20130426/5609_1 /TAXON_ID=2792 /ORGANISM="Porphyridium aerugineum, Strain SAG 1380-2" /LENGTH=187 /DNA_ID=CAMNT_0027158345 /DNA_START=55 /DNA_END=614 /DNA_ORIENTATION=-
MATVPSAGKAKSAPKTTKTTKTIRTTQSTKKATANQDSKPTTSEKKTRGKSSKAKIATEASATEVLPIDGKTLVIVESPAKAKTIQKYLSDDRYIVEACLGHIRDMPESNKQIPAKYKQFEWAKIGVNVENNFEPLYVLMEKKAKVITKLKTLMKDSQALVLATDGDREGEAISWHLVEVLKPKIPV